MIILFHQNVDHKMKYRSKKGQLPFIELNGEEVADSAIIIKELSQKFGHDLDAGLTTEQRNLAHATISMIENHLAWIVMWWRTKYPDQVLKGYKVNLQHALGTRIPNGILNFCFKFAFGRKVNIPPLFRKHERKIFIYYECCLLVVCGLIMNQSSTFHSIWLTHSDFVWMHPCMFFPVLCY